MAVFFLINGCSWQPGYGGRNDHKPGMEVERYFGWPACFYCDLWRSDEPMRIKPLEFAPPLPISRKMYFVYCQFGLVPLLLDAIFVSAGTVVVIIAIGEYRGKKQRCMTVLCWALVLLAIAIIKFGDSTSVYL
jgi:hypothetical protein